MAELPSSQSNHPATALRPKAARLKCSAEPRYGIIKTAVFILSSNTWQACFTYYQEYSCQVVSDKSVILTIKDNLVK